MNIRPRLLSPRTKRKSVKLPHWIDRDISVEFLQGIMKGVPEKALQVEVSRLQQKSIRRLGDLLDYSLAELEAIVRPATARSLAKYLPKPQSPSLSSPCLSPHLSHDQNSPVLLRNRLSLHIGAQDNASEFADSPSLGCRKVTLHLGNCGEDQDYLITLSVLQNLMPFAEREVLQQDLKKLTDAGIVHMNQISGQSPEDLQAIVGPATAKLLKEFSKRDSARAKPFLSISPQNNSTIHFFPRRSEDLLLAPCLPCDI